MTVIEAPLRTLPPLPINVEVPDNLDGLGDSYQLELVLYDGEKESARAPIRVIEWPPMMMRGESRFRGPLCATRWAAFSKGELFSGPGDLEWKVDIEPTTTLTCGVLLRRPW